MASYTIKAGDNLSKIAKQYGTTVSALQQANNITNADKIRANSTLTIPGQNTNQNTSNYGATANHNYGTGSYGGKYMGSNTSSMYGNAKMDNAPGSTGYEKGTVTLNKKDDSGNIISSRTIEGVLPLGTSFRKTGNALADAQNVPDSSGIFAYAQGRTPGYLEHVSGYKGNGYVDAKGNYYDANGNYLREDGYFYEPGASVSKNGKYQDTGSGYTNAGYGVTYIPGAGTMYTKEANPYYGVSPNATLEIIDEAHGWSSGGGNLSGVQNTQQETTDNLIQQIIQADKKQQEDEERRRYEQMMAQGGIW